MNFRSIFCSLLLWIATGIVRADDFADKANEAFLSAQAASKAPVASSILSRYDMPGPSGVPLGGIGVGCIEFNPLGEFFRNGLNCVHDDYIIRDVPASFFAMWEAGAGNGPGHSLRLQRDSRVKFGMKGFDHSIYQGLFPTARVYFENEGSELATRASIYAYSGLVPNNARDSSLPVVWFEVTLVNPGRKTEVSVAFSWQDIIGRGIFDVKEGARLPLTGGFDKAKAGGPIPRVATFVEPREIDGWSGYEISTPKPFQPLQPSYQNYVQQVAILTEKTSDVKISVLPAWDDKSAETAWAPFREKGEFNPTFVRTPLYRPGQAGEKASAIAVKTTLAVGEIKTIRFGLVWYFPELKSESKNYGTADYGRYFHNFFKSEEELFRYAATNRERILNETLALQKPILESTYPEWLQFMILNCGYEIYTNSILNKAGFFTENEGGMGGLAGTVGCRAVSRNFHQRFFPELDRDDQMRSAASQDPSGSILHFTGNYYSALADRQGYTPVPHSTYMDDAPGWICMLDTDYRQSGDKEWLRRMMPNIKKALAYIKKAYVPGTHLPAGGAAYDDFTHPKIYSYLATYYLSTLSALRHIAEAVGDQELIDFCKTETPLVREEFIRYLWNGRFFAQGCDPGGGNRQDFCMFTGQLAGQFTNRVYNGDDIVPMEMVQAAVVAQYKTSVAHSPEHYPDKRFDLNTWRGMDMPGSRCWPFYLEMYTAMLALQAGYYDDGMQLMREIQDVNLNRGFAWTLNLWRPGELTRMDSPVTWYMTDVLAGFGVDVAKKTLFLAPIVPPSSPAPLKLPVYTRRFWGIVGIDPARKYIALRVLKTFGDPLVVETVVSQPAGLSSSEAKRVSLASVTLTENTVLDLSPHYDEIVRGAFYPSILADPGATPWKTVKNPYTGDDGYDPKLSDLLRVWDKDYVSGTAPPTK